MRRFPLAQWRVNDPEDYWLRWANVKKRQARQAESLAGVASGIGEYGIANRLWQLERILRNHYTDNMQRAAEERAKKEADADTQQGGQAKRRARRSAT